MTATTCVRYSDRPYRVVLSASATCGDTSYRLWGAAEQSTAISYERLREPSLSVLSFYRELRHTVGDGGKNARLSESKWGLGGFVI